MSLSTTQEVKQTFHLVALRKESKELLTGRQWETTQSFSQTLQRSPWERKRTF